MSKQQKTGRVSVNKPVRARDEKTATKPREIGGPKGKEPTRYGDWEKNGRCIDF